MTENEEKLDAVKSKIRKFENSRTLIAALFALLCYYIYDPVKEGEGSAFYYVAIGIIMVADICVFIYVTKIIRKLAKERKELEQQ